jgi:sulfur-carrier protein
MKTLTVQYFAQLCEDAKTAQEVVRSDAISLQALYLERQSVHGFAFPIAVLKPVCNDQLVSWDHPFQEGDVISFLPPFSGG